MQLTLPCAVPAAGVLFYANLVVDVSFLVDLGLQPFMGFWDEEHDTWVMDLPAIRARYLRGWAAVDCVAAMPYDVIAVAARDSWIARLQVTWCEQPCIVPLLLWKAMNGL